jgi:hypothetical protein
MTRCDLSAPDATCPRCGFVSKVRNAIRQCRKPLPTTCGPGCQLRRTLSWFVRDDGKCGCTEYAAEMDRDGPDGCEARIGEIVAHLVEQAAKKSVFLGAVPSAAILVVVQRAIAAARAEAAAATSATPPPG